MAFTPAEQALLLEALDREVGARGAGGGVDFRTWLVEVADDPAGFLAALKVHLATLAAERADQLATLDARAAEEARRAGEDLVALDDLQKKI